MRLTREDRGWEPGARRQVLGARTPSEASESVQPETSCATAGSQGPECQPLSSRPRLPFFGRRPPKFFLYLLVSALLLAPCYWQRRIQAGDLSSHIYNSWLAQLAESGRVQVSHFAATHQAGADLPAHPLPRK